MTKLLQKIMSTYVQKKNKSKGIYTKRKVVKLSVIFVYDFDLCLCVFSNFSNNDMNYDLVGGGSLF